MRTVGVGEALVVVGVGGKRRDLVTSGYKGRDGVLVEGSSVVMSTPPSTSDEIFEPLYLLSFVKSPR